MIRLFSILALPILASCLIVTRMEPTPRKLNPPSSPSPSTLLYAVFPSSGGILNAAKLRPFIENSAFYVNYKEVSPEVLTQASPSEPGESLLLISLASSTSPYGCAQGLFTGEIFSYEQFTTFITLSFYRRAGASSPFVLTKAQVYQIKLNRS